MTQVQTLRGGVEPDRLGVTLMHEHVFVRDLELERNLADPGFEPDAAIDRAVELFETLHELGIRTVVDLTVPGLGRDVRTVAAVAQRSTIHIVAATGWYTRHHLPLHFQLRGPGRRIDGPDELAQLFVEDIERGIAGTAVRAGMLKVVTDEAGITPDIAWIMRAAAFAQLATGVPITTHSDPKLRNGVDQQQFLASLGVPLERVIIGHAGDTEDIDHLRVLMDRGSTIGMDRFGMEHVLPDDRRVATVLRLLRLGYSDRMILSHDAAVSSHVTPPSWRAKHAPAWHMKTIPRRILPMLREGGASEDELDQMLVVNPRRLLEPRQPPDRRATEARP
jgi:phosphotriesterase-related protein